MKCYYHQDSDAIGLCKACSKGVCVQCAIDAGGGLACRGSCEETVRSINALISGSTNRVASRLRASYFWAAFIVTLGVLFVLAPLLSGKPMSAFTTATGFVFCAFGVLLAFYQRAFNKAYLRNAEQAAAGDAGPRRRPG